MAAGELVQLEAAEGWWMLDLQMYGTTGYGGVYLLDSSPPVVVDTGMGRHTGWICELLDRWGSIGPHRLASWSRMCISTMPVGSRICVMLSLTRGCTRMAVVLHIWSTQRG
jgi:hypothetical protein